MKSKILILEGKQTQTINKIQHYTILFNHPEIVKYKKGDNYCPSYYSKSSFSCHIDNL